LVGEGHIFYEPEWQDQADLVTVEGDKIVVTPAAISAEKVFEELPNGDDLEQSDEEDEALEKTEDNTKLSEMSDKYIQKLCKLTQLQLELCKQTCDDLDKSCQVLKPVNKSLRQQTNQVHARTVNALKPQSALWTQVKAQSMLSAKQI